MNSMWLSRAAAVMALLGVPAGVSAQPSVFKDCVECPEMVVIPAGRFLMGSRADDPTVTNPHPNEQPQHEVTLKSFALGKYEVTQEQWIAVMGDNPSSEKGDTLPVEDVSWDDVQVFIQKLNAKTGKRYRLPTEAEWEYAARAGSTTLFSFGDDASQMHAHGWFQGNSDGRPHPVGKKLPNRFDLHDMHGNFWEMVQDCYTDDYADAPVDGSAAQNSDAACDRVIRGGSWMLVPEILRSALRSLTGQSTRRGSDTEGFRLALTLP
jgi:formylglycine-generating enzyme required for sulfatase activity